MTSDPMLDLSVLERLLGGNRELMRKFAGRFVDTTAEALVEIDSALGAADLEQLRHLGHRTRSAALAVGASAMAESCQQLEQLAGDAAAAARVVADLQAAFAATAGRLQAARLL